ncbi:acetyl-CoA carboxylase biotin carboxyl carrier protein, partial [Clostridioides difficile]
MNISIVVEEGDTLCILEAMKLMNEITSEIKGEIIEVLVSNEELVEYN